MKSIQLSQLQEQLENSVGQMNSQPFAEFLNCNYRSVGIVKWYDRKKGYGFVRSMLSGEDLFVHHHDLALSPSFREEGYLVSGEYVEYEKVSVGDKAGYSFKAVHVKGVCGGPLMCESAVTAAVSTAAQFTPLDRVAPAGSVPPAFAHRPYARNHSGSMRRKTPSAGA